MLKPCEGALESLYAYCGSIVVGSDGYESSDSLLGLSMELTGVGEYTLTFDADSKPSLVKCVSILPLSSTAVDMVVQLKSVSTSAIVFRTLVSDTPTTVSHGTTFYIRVDAKKTGVVR